MKVGILNSKSAEVNGTKTKSLRCGRIKRLINDKRAKQGKTPLLDSQMVSMGVLSDDFATVDVREELCYHSLTEKANSRGKRNGKTNYEKAVRGGKSGSRSPSGSAGTAPHRRAFGLVFRVVLVVFSMACAWLRRASARRTCLCQAHATVPKLFT